MKRIIIIVCVCVFMCIPQGCTSKQLNERMVIQGMGIDYTDNNYMVTVMYMNTDATNQNEPFKTLTGKGVGKMEVLNVKVDPEKIDSIVDKVHFFPSYHMNKKNWLSIVLNEGCPLETIFAFIDESYRLNGLANN